MGLRVVPLLYACYGPKSGDDRRLPAGAPERSRGKTRGDRPRGLARACQAVSSNERSCRRDQGVPSRDIIRLHFETGASESAPLRSRRGRSRQGPFVDRDPASRSDRLLTGKAGKNLDRLLYGLHRQRLAAAVCRESWEAEFCPTAGEETFPFLPSRQRTTATEMDSNLQSELEED